MTRTRLSRPSYLLAALFPFFYAQTALAGGTITTAVTGPVSTSAPAGGTGSGTNTDIDVIFGGSVTVSSDHAVLVDSNNDVDNDGDITSNDDVGGIGIFVNTTGGRTSDITNTQNIAAPGATGPNYGILVDNDGLLTGNISNTSDGIISVSGTNSVGIWVQGGLLGDILNQNSITLTGDNAIGIRLDGLSTGNVTNSGTGVISSSGLGGVGILIGGSLTGTVTNTETIATGGHGIFAAASISGGIFNDGDSVLGTTDADGQITTTNTTSAGSAIFVSSGGTYSTTAQNIVIGGSTTYGIINQGALTSSSTTSGTAVNTIRIDGTSVNPVLISGTMSGTGGFGGIFNDTGSIGGAAVDATAAGISIGPYGVVPNIINSGTISIITTVGSGNTGGNAYGVYIDPLGAVENFENSGTMTIVAGGGATRAVGVFDESGTLSFVTNSGTVDIFEQSGTTGTSAAFDLSANTGGITFANTGTINGRIFFGSGSDTLTNTGGSINSNIAFGAGTNQFTLTNSTFSYGLSATGGTLDFTGANAILNNTGTTSYAFRNASFDANSTLGISIWGFQNLIGGVAGTGMVSIADGANLAVTMRSLQTTDVVLYNIVTAGTLTATPTSLDLQNSNILYDMSLAKVGQNLQLTVDRKPFTQMGLFPNQAAAFEAGFDILAAQSDISAALGSITTQADLKTALNQFLPTDDSAGIDIMHAFNNASSGAQLNRLNMLRDIDHLGRVIGRGYLNELNAPALNGAGSITQDHGASFAQPWQGLSRADQILKENSKRLYANGKTYSSGPSIWGQQSYSTWDREAAGSGRGFDGLTYAFTGGIDAPMLGLNALGLSFTYGGGEIREDAPSQDEPLTVSTRQVNLYGSLWSHGFFLDGSAGVGFDKYESERKVIFGGVSRTSISDWTGRHYTADVKTGLRARAGIFGIGVSSGLGLLKVKENAHQETGGGAGVDLSIASRNTTSVLGHAGFDGDMWLPLDEQEESFLTLTFRGGFAYEFGDDFARTEARFVGSPNSFVTSSNALDGSRFYGGVGVGILFEGASLTLNYDTEFQDDYLGHMLGVTGRFRF